MQNQEEYDERIIDYVSGDHSIRNLIRGNLDTVEVNAKPKEMVKLFEAKKELLLMGSKNMEEESVESFDWVLVEESLPFLNYLKDRTDGSPFQNKHFLIVLHFLSDLIPFLNALEENGLERDKIHLFYKELYPYKYFGEVKNKLEDKYSVYPLSDPDTTDLQDILGELNEHPPEDEVVVIEDGGYISPKLHKDYESLKAKVIGGVEQTTKGRRELEKIENELSFPVNSVADSEFKLKFESPFVGKEIVDSIEDVFGELEVFLLSKDVLIIGFGSIGQKVGEELQRKNCHVTVVDEDSLQRLKATVNGFEVGKSVENHVEGKGVIIGCTGRETITRNVIQNLSHNTYIVSASSDKKEIDIQKFEALSKDTGGKEDIKSPGGEKLGTKYTLRGTDKLVNLLGDGLPITFYNREGIPNRASDFVMGLIYLATQDICDNHDQMENCLYSCRVDEVVKRYDLSEVWRKCFK